jgi:hypothetical protein
MKLIDYVRYKIRYALFKVCYWYAKWYLIKHRKEVYAGSERLTVELFKCFNTTGSIPRIKQKEIEDILNECQVVK